MSTRGVYRDSGGGREVSLTLPERYKRVVEGHFQLQRWYKGLLEMIYAPPGYY